MPTIKFIVDTKASIKRIELDEHTHFVPVDVNGKVGRKDLLQGYAGVAVLYLHGSFGQTAKFKIVQAIDGVDVVLAERNFIKISSQNGKSTSNVAFTVR